MEKFCSSCGLEYQNEDLYCGNCGKHRNGVEEIEKRLKRQRVTKLITKTVMGIGAVGALIIVLLIMNPLGIGDIGTSTKSEAIEDKWYGINGRITFDKGEVTLDRDGLISEGLYDFDNEKNEGEIEIDGERYDFELEDDVLVLDELGTYYEDNKDERLLEAIEALDKALVDNNKPNSLNSSDSLNNTDSLDNLDNSQDPDNKENIGNIPLAIDFMGMKESDIVEILGEPTFRGNFDYQKSLFYDRYELSIMIDTSVSNGDVIALKAMGEIQVMDSVMLQETRFSSISGYRQYDALAGYMIVDVEGYSLKLTGDTTINNVEIYKSNSAIDNMHSGAYYMTWTYDEIIDSFGKYYYNFEADGYDVIGYDGLPYDFYFQQGGTETLGNRLPYYITVSGDGYVFDSFSMLGMSEDELLSIASDKMFYPFIFDDHIDLYDTSLHFKCYGNENNDRISYVNIYYQRDKYEPVSSWDDLMVMDYLGVFDDTVKKEMQRKYAYLREKFGVEIYIALTDELYGMTESEYTNALYNNHKTSQATGGYSLLYLPNRNPEEVYFGTFEYAPKDEDFSTLVAENFLTNLELYEESEYREILAIWLFLGDLEDFLMDEQ